MNNRIKLVELKSIIKNMIMEEMGEKSPLNLLVVSGRTILKTINMKPGYKTIIGKNADNFGVGKKLPIPGGIKQDFSHIDDKHVELKIVDVGIDGSYKISIKNISDDGTLLVLKGTEESNVDVGETIELSGVLRHSEMPGFLLSLSKQGHGKFDGGIVVFYILIDGEYNKKEFYRRIFNIN